jgi:competence protein ComEA
MKTAIVGFLKITLTALFLAGLTGLAATPMQTGEKTKQETVQKKQGGEEGAAESEKISINTADSDELQTLPRIGPKIAQRIIEFREQHGPFEKLDDLMNVSGIGEKTFARLNPLIKL